MKKVAIDVRMINASGIGTYIKELLPILINNMPQVYFILLGCENELRQFEWIKNNNIEIISMNSSIYTIKEQFELLIKTPKDIDLFWSPHYNIPLLLKRKLLVTVHDVFHLAMPQYVNSKLKKLYAACMFKSISKKANFIIVVSNFTKNEFIKYVGKPVGRIETVYNGVKAFFLENNMYHPCKNAEKYILYVGNVKPHKNVSILLEAFKTLKEKIPHNLVIVGKKDGFITGDDSIVNISKEISDDRVEFTGTISEIDLKKYYAEADLFVFPSYYEGFGLPPLEAMSVGCPVIVSKSASLPEVCGDAVLYIDPKDPKELVDKMLEVLTDSEFSTELINRGKKRSQFFSWENSARKTKEIIEGLIGEIF